MLDKVREPDSARLCGKSNKTDDRRAHDQNEGESRQTTPAISSKVGVSEPEIVIDDHGCPFRHDSRSDVRIMFLIAEAVN